MKLNLLDMTSHNSNQQSDISNNTSQQRTTHKQTVSTGNNTHSWIKFLRAAPTPTQAVTVNFNVVCMDMENQEQRVFESIRCRLKEDLDNVEAQSRVAAEVSNDVVARAERLMEELSSCSSQSKS